MKFSELASFFQKLEQTSSRNAMTEILAKLFKKADKEEIDKICYLTQGRVAPLFVPLEFGMADKMIIKAIGRGCNTEEKEVLRVFRELGDLGKVAEKLAEKLEIRNLKLGVQEVFEVLEKVAKASGEGSVEQKTRLLADLLKNLDTLSARYVVRIPLGKLRLGFSDMTVLDALSWMIGGGKQARPEIEKAYNVRPDLGFIAKTIKDKGLKGLWGVKPQVGVPILMARAERLSSGEEIIEKIGKCAIEPKIDGFRLQVHLSDGSRLPKRHLGGGRMDSSEVDNRVRLFSRNLEDVTSMYPDIVESVIEQIKAKEAIFEGEAIGYDAKNDRYLPFQETVQRKRKYDIEAMSKKVPLRLIVFDLLYANGENLINKPFLARRKRLEGVVKF